MKKEKRCAVGLATWIALCGLFAALPFLKSADFQQRKALQNDERGLLPSFITPFILDHDEVSIVITTNYIPSAPSIDIINTTIKSFRYLQGLRSSTRVVIAVDGLPAKDEVRDQRRRLDEYIQNLREAYSAPSFVILSPKGGRRGLTANVYRALEYVTTEFVYIIQHDMPFVRHVDHAQLVQLMRANSEKLRLVRFNLFENVPRLRLETNHSCYANETGISHATSSVVARPISFIKTWIWSDNNHLTQKAYYMEMKQILLSRNKGHLPPAMEYVMRNVARKNCSSWGPHYYGAFGEKPTIKHLDGRSVGLTARSDNDSCDLDTSVIVTTNYLPSAPGMFIINATIMSVIKHLKGLCDSAPIILAVDGLNLEQLDDLEKQNNMRAYVRALKDTYQNRRFTVVESRDHLAITGNVYHALNVVNTTFVYILQHDLPFIQDIDHTSTVRAMRNDPGRLKLIRFGLRRGRPRLEALRDSYCFKTDLQHSGNQSGIQFSKTPVWSDNNHLTTKKYYTAIKPLLRRNDGSYAWAMEFVMRNIAQSNCSYWGPHYYGPTNSTPYIQHLDGREAHRDGTKTNRQISPPVWRTAKSSFLH